MAARRQAIPPNGNGCANRQSISHSSDDSEQVQTARIDYNMNESNIDLVSFSGRHGPAGGVHGPDQSVVQRRFSAAAVFVRHRIHARVFAESGELFQSGVFLVREPVRSSGSSRRRWRPGRSCSARQVRSRPSEGSTTRGFKGRRASRFFINDNLAWTRGAHELRFGTNIRIFRLNDYDFGEGVVPTVSYATLPQFIYGMASTASETFPQADSQPYNFLNLDVYAQDTWKITKTLTWTFGLRATHNSNPVNPHDAVARLPGSWDAISHDVNQPLEALIQTQLGNIFASTPLAILQPRMALAWQAASKTVLRTGFGLFSDILPGSVVDLVGINPPYSKTFQGGLLGTAGGIGTSTARLPRLSRPTRRSPPGSRKGSYPARRRYRIRRHAYSRWRSRRFRTASSTRHISCNGASRWNSRSARR